MVRVEERLSGQYPSSYSTKSIDYSYTRGTRVIPKRDLIVYELQLHTTSAHSGRNIAARIWKPNGELIGIGQSIVLTNSNKQSISRFNTPIKLNAGETYIIGYYSPDGAGVGYTNITSNDSERYVDRTHLSYNWYSYEGVGDTFPTTQYSHNILQTITYEINDAPTLTLNTTNNRTLYENDTFSIDGTTRDTDSGNVVNVKYQINSGTVRAIATHISNGSAFPFNKVLTFKQNKLFDGTSAVTADLAEGTQHVLKVWAEDDQGGKSAEQVRTFYVVPNRPATLTIEPFSTRTDLIDSDSITINGSVSDPDNNTVTVKYKIANGSYSDVYNGESGPFSFNLPLSMLLPGANTITVQAVDSYGAINSKTLQVTKAENNQPLLTSVARYKLTPPNGTAKGVVLWIQREVGDLVVDAEISMGMNGQAENFLPMTKESTAFVSEGIEEDEFTFDNISDAENIILKLTMTRSSTASDKGIKLISGVLS